MKQLFMIICSFLLLCASVNASTIIQNGDLGYYNFSLGRTLDGSFATAGDPTSINIPLPDLSAASSSLGAWLTDPGSLSTDTNWSNQIIPGDWQVNDETAIVYEFSGGYDNVSALFGVDNGIFVWLDGVYQNGWMNSGSSYQWEYSLDIGSLSAGTHYLQVLREDHGGGTGYDILVTGNPVPEPATMFLFGIGLLGLAGVSRRK